MPGAAGAERSEALGADRREAPLDYLIVRGTSRLGLLVLLSFANLSSKDMPESRNIAIKRDNVALPYKIPLTDEFLNIAGGILKLDPANASTFVAVQITLGKNFSTIAVITGGCDQFEPCKGLKRIDGGVCFGHE